MGTVLAGRSDGSNGWKTLSMVWKICLVNCSLDMDAGCQIPVMSSMQTSECASVAVGGGFDVGTVGEDLLRSPAVVQGGVRGILCWIENCR
jgi:hypothetical protein